jgi:serine protease Do
MARTSHAGPVRGVSSVNHMSPLRYALATVSLVLQATATAAQTRPRAASTSAELSSALEATTALVAPAVVEIFTTSYTPANGLVPRTADLITTERASGSGVIVDPEGYIVTNAHVVRGAQRLRVDIPVPITGQSILAQRSRTVIGQLVGIDVETDLAVVRIGERNLTALAFGDSDALKAGQVVLALGNPLGLHNSVSLGVVSAVARQLEPESPMIYVQTDASINPGSSGGPLVDMSGRIVGINTLIASRAGGNEGLGFAAPSNIVRAVYEQIRKYGRVRRGDIGVRAQTVTPALASGLKLERDRGVILADVRPGSPGARAGLRPGDLILALDGKPMENGRQFQVGLYRRTVGDAITLDVQRGDLTWKVPVSIAERHDPVGNLAASIDPRENLVPRLGVLAVKLDARIAAMLPTARGQSGVVIASTVPGAIDSRDGGLAPGDIVYAVNRTAINGLDDFRAAVDALKAGDPVVLQLERDGELMFLAFTIE